MPLGGKKKKKGKKKPHVTKRRLRYRLLNEDYAQVKCLYGDRRVQVQISGKGLRKAHIPGRFRKRMWINKDDWVLVQYRTCDVREDSFCDIVHLYTRNEVRKLEQSGEIQMKKSLEQEDFLEFEDIGTEDSLEEIENEIPQRGEIEYPSSFTPSASEEEEEI